MSVTSRKSTNLETLIPLIKAPIIQVFGPQPNPAGGIPLPAVIDGGRIFAALASDDDLMARAPADSFISVNPVDFPIWEEAVTGGGNDLLWVDGGVEITLFLRYGVDQGFADDSYLLDPTFGVLPRWSTMIHVLQLYDPVDANGVGFLAEPMRLAMGGWRNMRRTRSGIATWGRLKSFWEVKYVHAV